MQRTLYYTFCLLLLLIFPAGCGTTRTTNTQRTATEQLLISDAIDRAVQEIDFTALSGNDVYFDDRHLNGMVDSGYLISSMRQHLLASGCVLKDKREDADFVVEPRAGAVGTDNHDLLFGLPAVNLPQVSALATLPPAIPEIPIAKRRNQRGIVKIGVFAYHRESGRPAWQSGIASNESTSNDIWILGAGPFKRGTIHEGTRFAGGPLPELIDEGVHSADNNITRIDRPAVFDKSLVREEVGTQDPATDIRQASVEQEVKRVSPDDSADEANNEGAPPVLAPPGAAP